ncbi:MAG: hypothetical protein HYR73_02295 [Candidatus Eisenbacteria bacterium]|nr:hypothetical protein [Candidatus Eisenbacteria bacterium]
MRGTATCIPESVRVDTSQATNVGDIVMGKAWGETFTAADTLIESVTAWRIPSEHNNPSQLKFWITEVDSGGTPHTHLVVYDGPTLSFTSPDSTRPTPITYAFDPPISLPRPSVYCFWVQEVCTGYADLLIDANDAYSGGHLWETYRSDFDGCILRDYPDPRYPGADLVFTLVFCNTHSTPARNPTWGQLKARYR